MEMDISKIKKPVEDYKGNVSVQTGFPSPATHYREPTIDLNKELSTSRDATFFVRVKSNDWKEYNILKDDVLIIDRSLKPTEKQLVLVIIEGNFDVQYFDKEAQDEVVLWGVLTYIIHKAI